MSETTTEQTAPDADPGEQEQPSDLGDAGKKALDAMKAERNAAKREKDALQAQLDQISRANESALDKAMREAQEASAARDQAISEALRWRVAARFGISDDDAETFLSGTDEATLTRQAERLSAMAKVEPGTPKPDRSQGSGSTPALNSDALEQALRDKLGI